jgi:hypothetical protein
MVPNVFLISEGIHYRMAHLPYNITGDAREESGGAFMGSKFRSYKMLWRLLPVGAVMSLVLTASGKRQDAPKAPAPRAHHSGVYDAARREFLIYGGFTFDGQVRRLTDVWAWNGRVWRFVGDTGVPKIVAPLAYDSKRQRVLMFGGSDAEQSDGKLRTLEGKSWQIVTDAPDIARDDASLTYDSRRDCLVLFGGTNRGLFYADTWEYSGSGWKQTYRSGPSLRSAGAAVYDSARGVTVLYGGFRPLSALGDTWEWDGNRWKLITESGPGPRSWPGIAYDSKRKRTILFGGEDDRGRFYADTWAWDGKRWTRIATGGPPARIQFVMGYDSARDRVVLFGGMKMPPTYLNDVWEFDGARWMQK